MSNEYHLDELKIALDPSHPAHILPPATPAHNKILDLGCGAGQTMIAAYPDRTTFGLDIDLTVLRFGKTLSDKVRFCCGSAESLPYGDDVFDLVIARVSLAYTDIRSALLEIRRVLKPDGRIWITLHPWRIPWQLAKRSNWRGKLFFLYVLANSLSFRLLQRQFSFLGKQESFQTASGIRRALCRAGFDEVQITNGRHFLVEARSSKAPIAGPVLSERISPASLHNR